jgi:mycofactocin system creatininase family protein
VTGLLAEMTWTEVEDAVINGATTVILPLGATEQHGPHLPLGTDTFRAAAVAERLAAALPKTLVAPALPIGCSDEHTGFAGLLSLDHATLAGIIVDCATRMAAWGVRRLVLLSAHGGNASALALASAQLRERACPLVVLILAASTSLTEALQRIAREDGVTADALGLHAGEGETSEMLHLRPDLVRFEHLLPGYAGPMADIVAQLRQSGLRAVTATGTLGDPCAAEAGRGARYLDAQVRAYRQRLTERPCPSQGPEPPR